MLRDPSSLGVFLGNFFMLLEILCKLAIHAKQCACFTMMVKRSANHVRMHVKLRRTSTKGMYVDLVLGVDFCGFEYIGV